MQTFLDICFILVMTQFVLLSCLGQKEIAYFTLSIIRKFTLPIWFIFLISDLVFVIYGITCLISDLTSHG